MGTSTATTQRRPYDKNRHLKQIQDGGGRHFEISKMAITLPVLNGFAPSLTQRPRIMSLDNF